MNSTKCNRIEYRPEKSSRKRSVKAVSWSFDLSAKMTDKDNARPYHYEPYPAKPNNTNSLKRNEIKTNSNSSSLIHNPTNKQSSNSKCCCCTMSARSATFWASFLTNLGICSLLFGYTLLGKWLWRIIITLSLRRLCFCNEHKPQKLSLNYLLKY